MTQKVLLTDPLTGLYSRATLPMRLQQEAERAGRYSESFSILVIDLDYFKSINDAFGHSRGDQVLSEFSRRMETILRASDILYRYGGDEFVVLLPKTNKGQALMLARRILQGISGNPMAGEPPITLSLSLGIATFPEDGQIPEEIFEKADMRCLDAKRSGRGRFTAEEAEHPAVPLFQEAKRLIERDQELLSLTHFLIQLGSNQRGALLVAGPTGSGRSLFLEEASKLARLQGYEVLFLRCTAALRLRSLGALAEACLQIDNPPPSGTLQEFEHQQAQRIREKDRTGLFLCVDDIHQADAATLDILSHLLLMSGLPRVGIAYSFDQSALPPEVNFARLSLSEQITLQPINQNSVKIWLRNALLWDAPEDFVTWLHKQSSGLPGNLQHCLTLLYKRNTLIKTGEGWSLRPDFASVDLREWLNTRRRPIPNNLPASPTTFVGRDHEIRQAKELLSQERMLTILGPGGMGKTRLAQQVATEMMSVFPDGVFFLPLAPIENEQVNVRMVSALAEALSFPFLGQQEPKTQLLNYLREKNLLILLDNFEHVLPGTELVAEILEHAGQVKILATSRERLNLRGEAVLELQGMGFSQDNEYSDIERSNAIRLFVFNARRANPNFKLDETNKAAITQICQVVEGLPLGIELAAAWVRMLTPQEIIEELKQSLDFLSSDAGLRPQRDLPGRHQSLRAVFDSSWNLLNPAEQLALRRLAVFQHGFQREAALAITGTPLRTLSALTDKSLIYRLAPSESQPSTSYLLHEVLRAYAQEKLKQFPAEAAQLLGQHAHYYADFLSKRQDLLLFGRQAEVEQVDAEMDEIRRAWQYAVQQGLIDLCNLMMDGLSHILRIHGFFPEGRELFKKAADHFAMQATASSEQQLESELLAARLRLRQAMCDIRLGNYQAAREALDSSQEMIDNSNDLEKARWLEHYASLENYTSHYELSQKYTQQALEIYQAIHDLPGIAACYIQLGIVAEALGNFKQAQQLFLNGLDLCRQLNDPWGETRALINLGNVESELGNLDQSRQHYQDGLELSRRLHNHLGAAVLLNNLGDVARELCNYEEARQLLRQSIQEYDQVGDRFGKVVALHNLGDATIHLGEFDQANEILNQALQISHEMNHPIGEGYALKALGMLCQQRGDAAQAYHYLVQSLRSAQVSQSPPFMAEVLEQLAEFYLHFGQPGRAAEILIFVQQFSASSSYVREAASQKLDSVKEQISDRAWLDIEAHIHSHTLDNLIEEILTWQPKTPV